MFSSLSSMAICVHGTRLQIPKSQPMIVAARAQPTIRWELHCRFNTRPPISSLSIDIPSIDDTICRGAHLGNSIWERVPSSHVAVSSKLWSHHRKIVKPFDLRLMMYQPHLTEMLLCAQDSYGCETCDFRAANSIKHPYSLIRAVWDKILAVRG